MKINDVLLNANRLLVNCKSGWRLCGFREWSGGVEEGKG